MACRCSRIASSPIPSSPVVHVQPMQLICPKTSIALAPSWVHRSVVPTRLIGPDHRQQRRQLLRTTTLVGRCRFRLSGLLLFGGFTLSLTCGLPSSLFPFLDAFLLRLPPSVITLLRPGRFDGQLVSGLLHVVVRASYPRPWWGFGWASGFGGGAGKTDGHQQSDEPADGQDGDHCAFDHPSTVSMSKGALSNRLGSSVSSSTHPQELSTGGSNWCSKAESTWEHPLKPVLGTNVGLGLTDLTKKIGFPSSPKSGGGRAALGG